MVLMMSSQTFKMFFTNTLFYSKTLQTGNGFAQIAIQIKWKWSVKHKDVAKSEQEDGADAKICSLISSKKSTWTAWKHFYPQQSAISAAPYLPWALWKVARANSLWKSFSANLQNSSVWLSSETSVKQILKESLSFLMLLVKLSSKHVLLLAMKHSQKLKCVSSQQTQFHSSMSSMNWISTKRAKKK